MMAAAVTARALGIVGYRLQRLGERVASSATEGPTLVGDRDIEWSWTAIHIQRAPGRVLDFGAGSGVLSIAAALAGHEVVAVDLEPCQFRFDSPRIQYRRGDLLELDFGNESFDQIVNCSSIEHVGLSGRYGSPAREDGDLAAMRKLRSLLRAGGEMILTLPVGQGGMFSPFHRIYDEGQLDRLCEGFDIEAEEYWAKTGSEMWRPVSRPVALAEQGSERYYGLGLFVLRRGDDAGR